MSQKKRTCSKCRKKKLPKEFYSAREYCCRSCTRTRAKLWAKKNPKRRREISRKYVLSAKGRATITKTRRIWRHRNTAGDRAQNQRYLARLPDAYLRKLLKARLGIISPTPEQIERQRTRVQIIRARKILSLIAYGPRKQH